MPEQLTAVVADDEQVQRDQVVEALRFAGFRIAASVPDGLAAVRAARLYRPDLAMLDILMPGLSGRDAALQIREFLPDVKIIMVTSMGQDGVLDVLRAQRFGIYIKPIVRDLVLEAVAQVFA